MPHRKCSLSKRTLRPIITVAGLDASTDEDKAERSTKCFYWEKTLLIECIREVYNEEHKIKDFKSNLAKSNC